MTTTREHDIVIYGSTGFTGRLVAEYMNKHYKVGGDVNWAMAGRSMSKLIAVRDELNIDPSIPLIVANADEPISIQSMVEQSRVVLSTVGPYQLYGSEIVAVCCKYGTDYVDLCGEPTWMYDMIKQHARKAEASGARIVFSCGFDSIPFDLGALFLQTQAEQQFGQTLNKISCRVRTLNGSWSGGTLASARATMDAAANNPETINVLMNPFALAGETKGPEQPDGNSVYFDQNVDSWVTPFVMAVINTKNIHRSNYLLGHPYGEDFCYDEMLMTGPGNQGEQLAQQVAGDSSMLTDETQPGEGPSKKERDDGCYDLLIVGSTKNGKQLKASIKGDKDPGYGSTSGMIAESALSLLLNTNQVKGGIWTPASALGTELIDRLVSKAGLSFELE